MKPEVVLRKLKMEDEDELLKAHRATSPEVPSFLHYYEDGISIARYLEILEEQENGINLPTKDHVPSTFLFAFVGNRLVGRVSIRHHLNSLLERASGHIGYVVVLEFRNKGIATQILDKAIEIFKAKTNENRILITCDDDNQASARVIEKNGGVLENIVEGPDLEKPKRRYWINAN